jgi:hypothetical protein
VKSIDFHPQLNKSPCLSIEKEFLFSDFSQKRAIDESIEKFLEPWLFLINSKGMAGYFVKYYYCF